LLAAAPAAAARLDRADDIRVNGSAAMPETPLRSRQRDPR
jgi:hypothetical protein